MAEPFAPAPPGTALSDGWGGLITPLARATRGRGLPSVGRAQLGSKPGRPRGKCRRPYKPGPLTLRLVQYFIIYGAS